ncbi:MAG: class I SAM-dependent methyltransferase [Sphingobacteriales bacterium]|nr:class I SAM-dependent methyltransferase [Sphingobacteriales bacterium]
MKREKTAEHHLDDPQTTVHHGEIIKNKVFLRKIYIDWYNFLLKETPNLPEGKIVELGSGGGFLKELLDMPFEEESLSAIFMIDVLHHIPRCDLFFSEAQRTLKKAVKLL